MTSKNVVVSKSPEQPRCVTSLLISIQRMLCRDQEAAALAAAETEPGLLVQRAEQLMRRGDLVTALAVLDTAVTVLTDKQG